MSAEEFLEAAQMPVGSLQASEFIGVTEQRAFIHVSSGMPSSLGGGDDVYSVRLNALAPDLASRMRRGENPWERGGRLAGLSMQP